MESTEGFYPLPEVEEERKWAELTNASEHNKHSQLEAAKRKFEEEEAARKAAEAEAAEGEAAAGAEDAAATPAEGEAPAEAAAAALMQKSKPKK